MRFFRIILVLVMALSVSACATKFRKYRGPEVTSVQVHKADRKMYLLHNERVLRTYDIALGFTPVGHKQFEGDGKTPEGTYFITHKNPDSNYHLSLGVSYPNEFDLAVAEEAGQLPGGDIFIHGGPTMKNAAQDWTAGCIALTDRQIEVVYSMIKPNTPIQILQ